MDKNINMKGSSSSKKNEESKKGKKGEKSDGIKVSSYYPEFLKKAAHPGVCIWHILFKTGALVSYFLLNLFIDNYVITFIAVILLSAFDFWVVKNISGRILVGLRWWSKVKDDGSEEWYFESLEEKKNTGIDSFIFWAVLYITPIVWLILILASVLSFAIYNVTLCVAAFGLSGVNLYGYTKCEKDHNGKMKGFLIDQAMGRIEPTDIINAAGYAAKISGGK